MIIPRRRMTQIEGYPRLLREKKLGFGIEGVNSKMGVVGCLARVRGLADDGWEVEYGDDFDYDLAVQADEMEARELVALVELEAGERWFWEAREGEFLGGRREDEEVAIVSTAMEQLEVNPWAN